MRLTLVSLHASRNPEAIPLGAACIAAAIHADPALADRVETCLLESWLAPSADPLPDLIDRIKASRPDWIGFSIYVWNNQCMRRLAQILRAELPLVRFFAGGPDASADPDRVINEMGLDFVVVGEGEERVCRALLGWLDNQEPVLDYLPGPGVTPETLPSPWLDGSLIPVAGGGVLWEMARGCPFACTFCFESRGSHGVRFLPDARLEAEFELFRAAGIHHVFVLDPTFNARRQRALDWLARFARLGQDMRFTFEVRAEFLDAAQAKAFSAINCSVQIGLQSAHPAVLATVGRTLDRAGFIQKINLLNQHGVVFGLDLMYGLPHDSLSGFRQSLDWSLKLQPNHLDVFPLAVLPGTQLTLDAVGLGLNWQPEPPYLVQDQPGFDALDMGKARLLANAVDLFYNRGRAVPWFDIMIRALAIKPSILLGDFADRIFLQAPTIGVDEKNSHLEIENLQLEFLQGRFMDAGKQDLWPAAQDLVRLHGAWSRALAEGSDSVLELSYPPAALEDHGVLDLAGFFRRQPRQPGRYRVRAGPGGIRMEKIRR